MTWIDRLAEAWDRHRTIGICIGAVLFSAGPAMNRWMPNEFGPEVLTSVIPIVGPAQWNARLRFLAQEKDQFLGPAPERADDGDFYGPNHDDHSEGSSLIFRLYGSHEGMVAAGKSPILAITDDQAGRLATGAENGAIIVWEEMGSGSAIDTLKPIATLQINSAVTALALSENARFLAAGAQDGTIRIWDIAAQSRLMKTIKDQDRSVYALALSKDGSELWSGGFDGVLRRRQWQSSEKPISEKSRGGPIYALFQTSELQQNGERAEVWCDIGYYGGPNEESNGTCGFGSKVAYPSYSYTSVGGQIQTADWAGEDVSDPFRLSLSPDRRLVAVVQGRGRYKYVTVWEQGQFSFPFGLRFRGPVPPDFEDDEPFWSRDSKDLCFAKSIGAPSHCLGAATGKPSRWGPDVGLSAPALPNAPIKSGETVEAGQTTTDSLRGEKIVAAFRNGPPAIYVGHRSRRFPPIAVLLSTPFLALTLTLLISRSRYWINKRAYRPATRALQSFFSTIGSDALEIRLGILKVTRLDAPLDGYSPMPAVIAIGPADESQVELLVEKMNQMRPGVHPQAGFLVYSESPTAVAVLRMAEARLNQLAVIPMPLAAMERVKDSPAEARGLLQEYAERYLPGRNLFDDRNAIGDAVAFFGRGSLLAKLEQELNNRQSLGLWGLRKSGKTSILLQLEQILRAHTVVRIDLQAFTARGPFGNRIFNEILRQLCVALHRLGRQVACPEFPANAPAHDSAFEFVGAVTRIASQLGEALMAPPIVCMLDEMERVLPGSAEAAEEFNVTFGALRSLCQDKRVMSLLVTDLFPDATQINHWPVTGTGTNPLFNFLKSVYAGPFRETDTVQMIQALGKLLNFELEPGELQRIHALSGGHPFLARQVAAMLYDHREDVPDRERLLANPIRYSETLRWYFVENIWNPLHARDDKPALAILKELARAKDWVTDAEIQARCAYPTTVLWAATDWLAQTGIIAREAAAPGAGQAVEEYRICIELFLQWYDQSEISS